MRIFIPLLLLAACSGTPQIPKDILAPQQMERIMWDFMQADGFMVNPVPSDSLGGHQAKRTELYQQVLHTHKTSKASFARSMKYYEDHPDLLKGVFEQLGKRVEKQPDFSTDSTKKRKPVLPKTLLK